MVVFGKKWLYSGKSFCSRTKLKYSGKVVVFGKKLLFSGKSGCIRTKVIVFGQKWLYSGNVVVFGQE